MHTTTTSTIKIINNKTTTIKEDKSSGKGRDKDNK